jgi:hypothetical protein
MNRRTFLQTATIGATSLAGLSLTSAYAAEKTDWPIGCFNRPWTKWSYDEALDGITAAGYKLTGLLSAHKGEAFTSSRKYAANTSIDRCVRVSSARPRSPTITSRLFASPHAWYQSIP